MWKRSREANSSVIPCCRRRHKSPSVKLLLHGFAMRLERSASLLNRKANTHCVRSVALSSCRGACLGQRLPVSTSWTGYISNHNITGVEKGPARTRPRTLWQLLVRLCPTTALCPFASPRDGQEHDGPPGTLGPADAFSLPQRYNFSARFTQTSYPFWPASRGSRFRSVQSAKQAIDFSSHSSRRRRRRFTLPPVLPDRSSVRCQNVLAAQISRYTRFIRPRGWNVARSIARKWREFGQEYSSDIRVCGEQYREFLELVSLVLGSWLFYVEY